MLARIALELLLFIGLALVIYLWFTKLLRSPYFSGFVKGAVPPPESDDEVLETVLGAEAQADQRASQNEAEAIAKVESAKKLRRRNVSDILAEKKRKK